MNDDIIKAVCAAVVLGEGENYEPVHLEPREARQAIAAYHAALAARSSLEPVAWCQPNYEGKIHPRKFMVVYEDSEMGNAVFDNENEAREHFDKASVAWNCYLFGLMPRSAAPQPVINPTHSQVAGTPGLLKDPAPADHVLAPVDAKERKE